MTASASLGTLLAVQSVDRKLAGLAERREELPEIRAEVAREITALERERVEREKSLEHSRLERRRHESELEMQQQHLERYEGQLNEVKTNVAYSALLTEIQGTKRAISELEEEILERMEEREGLEARIAEIDEGLEEKRAAAAGRLEELDQESASLDREISALEERRNALVPDIEPGLYRMYDRLRRGRRFPALVPLKGHACGACFGRMPPQVVREITHEGALHPCENCGVLVYAPAEAEAAGSPVVPADAG